MIIMPPTIGRRCGFEEQPSHGVDDFEAVVEAGGQAESDELAVEEGLRIPYPGMIAKKLVTDRKTWLKPRGVRTAVPTVSDSWL